MVTIFIFDGVTQQTSHSGFRLLRFAYIRIAQVALAMRFSREF